MLAGTSGWGAKAADQAVNEATHRARVLRLGYSDEGIEPVLLRRAAAVAYPSLAEGFGLPALEALAAGAPLVTTTGSAMEEVAAGAAILVEPGDADGLAGALDMLVRGDAGLSARRERSSCPTERAPRPCHWAIQRAGQAGREVGRVRMSSNALRARPLSQGSCFNPS